MSESTITSLMTMEQFEERLLNGDRWVELINGRFSQLNPPDDSHGDVVRNLSRSLAIFLRKSTDTYACFELPLIVAREPATVRCPAISFFRFQSQGRFAETDKVLTNTQPVLVIEVASSNERRDSMAERVRTYLEWGVSGVWVIDPVSRHAHQFHGKAKGLMLKEPQVLSGDPILPGFSIAISEIFREPKWMNTRNEPEGIS